MSSPVTVAVFTEKRIRNDCFLESLHFFLICHVSQIVKRRCEAYDAEPIVTGLNNAQYLLSGRLSDS